MSDVQSPGPGLDMAELWRRRIFEAVAGFWEWLVDDKSGKDFEEWLTVQQEIFSDLPADDDTAAWHRTFFRAQAAMERFIVTRYGEPEMAAWTKASARVFGKTAPAYGPGAAGLAVRIARQADGYSSVYSLGDNTAKRASITISHCGIWDYRERARSGGVGLTLDSPCTYCTRSMSANVSAKGFHATWSLSEKDSDHGCSWEVTA